MAVHARLKGHAADLEALTRQFKTGDLTIGLDSDGHYYITSAAFDGLLDDGRRLHEVASLAIQEINGLMRTLDSDFRPVEVVPRFSNEDGSRVSAVVFPPSIELRATVGTPTITVDGQVQEPAPPPGVGQLALTKKHPDVAEALGILGRSVDYSWDDLLKVYEIVRENVGGTGNQGTDEQRLRATNWLPLSEHLGFYNSANTKTISGDAARHARGRPKSSDTMPLQQGREMINRLVQRWLKSLS